MSRKGILLKFRRPSEPLATLPEQEVSDTALLAACAAGESVALGKLYDRHQRPLFRFVSRVASAPACDVEDLVQCTFVEVWNSATRFSGKGAVRSWIFGIAANLSRHYVRSEVRRRVAMDGLSQVPSSEGSRPDDRASRTQMVARLEGAVADLSYEQRVAFVLCDIEEMSGVEAARSLGIRQGTLWRRLHDARRSLRQMLEAGAQS